VSLEQEIVKGIGAHGLWKQRIVDAIKTGQSEWVPGKVRLDNQCEFGKWLYSCSSADKSTGHFEKVKILHADFHKVAAGVLDLALKGNKDEAQSAIAMKSDYRSISSSLTKEMMAWKDSTTRH